AVVVNQANFWGVRNYTNIRVKDINKTVIINNYRAAPVVNQTVIKNYNNRQRYNFTDVQVGKKPHQSVINRINKNRDIAGQTGRVHPVALEKKTADLKPGNIQGDAKIARPKVTDKLVSEHEVNKPKGEVKFKEREIKRTGRAPQERGEGRARDRADRPPRKSEEKPVVDHPEKAREGKDIRSPREPRSPLPEKSQADQDRRRQREDRPEIQGPGRWEPKPPREDARPRHGEDRVQPPARPRSEPGTPTQEMKQPRRDERQQIQDPRQRDPKPPREDVRPQRGEDRVQPPARPRSEPGTSTQEMKQPRRDERQQIQDPRQRDPKPPREDVRPQRGEDRVQPPARPRSEPGTSTQEMKHQGRDERQQPRETIQPQKQGSQRENKVQDKLGEKKQESKHGQMTP
ncbi:MAG: hypothetical protein KBH99_08295, partial [Syntrophobacteraceae bacterium]|nr:hypothetical protein [Syntrophobacteraceae bacterium]